MLKIKIFFDFKSNHGKCSVEKGVLINVPKFDRKTPVLGSVFNKVADLISPESLLKRESNTVVVFS